MDQLLSKWRTLIVLGMMCLAVVTGIAAIWGLLFLLWGVQTIRAGSANVIEHIERDENPILFWIIAGAWILSGLLLIASTIF